jgi:hypothetical protein
VRAEEERGSADTLESGSTSFAGIQTYSWHSSCRREPKMEIKVVIKWNLNKKNIVKKYFITSSYLRASSRSSSARTISKKSKCLKDKW